MAFVIGAYQAIERPGAGHRARPTSLWRGEDLRSGDQVAMTVLPADRAAAARDASALWSAIRHPHLLSVVDVAGDDRRAAVICPWPAGGRLAELVARRSVLTVGETLTVLIPLASALAVLHAAGIRHGDVCPETIWFDEPGRPLLGAPAVSRVVAEMNDALPEGSRDVAPELVRGEAVRSGPVTTSADVFSLGSVALRCLTGRSAWPADDPADVLVQSAAGVWPDPPDELGPAALIDLLRSMLRSEPDRRPSAAEVAAALTRIGGVAPLDFGSGPTPVPVSADRWRGWTAAARVGAGPTAVPHGGLVSAGSAQVGPALAPAGSGLAGSVHSGSALAGSTPAELPIASAVAGSTHSNAAGSDRPVADGTTPGTGDGRGRRPGPLARVGIAVLVGLLITVIAAQGVLWWSGSDDPTSLTAAPGDAAANATSPDTGAADWLGVVAGLDAARGRALAAADPALLAEVYVLATPPAEADARTIAQLAGAGWRVVDGRHDIVSVAPVDGAAADPGAPLVRLAIVDVLPAHPVLNAAGEQVGLTPGRSEQRRILVLAATEGGYRISAVEPG